ncbi:MAG: hypothetical protein ACYSUF_03025, partial [Planctomycetota bacterium]
ALPQGHRYAGGRLYLPGGDDVEVIPLPPDDEFPRVFAGACRRLPSRRDRRTIESYGVNVCLAGPGGSLEAAIRMLRAGAAVVRAGGAGVFVDNSGRAHPSRDWIDLADAPDDSDAYQAFVSLFSLRCRDQARGRRRVRVLRYHELSGLHDAARRRDCRRRLRR